MSESRRTTVVTAGLGQGRKVDCVSTARGQQMTHIRDDPLPSARPVPRRGARPMHQSTLTLGCPSAHPCYVTTHARSYSRRGEDGRPLRFYYRDAAFPSQHLSSLKLSHMVPVHVESHTRDVHRPKDIVPHHVLHGLGLRNRERNQLGLVMKEVANPPEPTLYQTTYRSNHSNISRTVTRVRSTGLPTQWHCHDILTGTTSQLALLHYAQGRSATLLALASHGDGAETACCGPPAPGRRIAVLLGSTDHSTEGRKQANQLLCLCHGTAPYCKQGRRSGQQREQ